MSNSGGAMSIRIRIATEKDATAIAALCSELGYSRSPKEIEDWFAMSASQAVFVAVEDRQVIGWIEVSIVRYLQEQAHSRIGGLIVTARSRGRGVGRLLCQQAEVWSREQGLRRVQLSSRESRTDAHRFYLNEGYSEIKRSVLFEKLL
jgi:GNAT superfamily N-acetyltransferase